MHDAVEVARLLDILGNRNRRRIIELLRQKPCFVTEISDTLTLSPKAVIDHLQMMERMEHLEDNIVEEVRNYEKIITTMLVDNDFQNSLDAPGIRRLDVTAMQVHPGPAVATDAAAERKQRHIVTSATMRTSNGHDGCSLGSRR